MARKNAPADACAFQPWPSREPFVAVLCVYHQRVDDVTAFILAGGKSTRMGRDKAFLPLGTETLLSRVIFLAGSITPEVRIVGDAGKFAAFGVVVPDVYRNRGPLAGIHAALRSTQTELNLVLAVDTPLISRCLLEFLLSKARRSGAVVTVPRTHGHLHPLCAVYRRAFGAPCEQALDAQRNRIDALFPDVRTTVIDEEELLQNGFPAQMFRNLNTPEDFAEAQRLQAESKEISGIHRN